MPAGAACGRPASTGSGLLGSTPRNATNFAKARRYTRTVVAGRLRTTCQPLDVLHDLSGQCTAWTRDVFTHVMGCVDSDHVVLHAGLWGNAVARDSGHPGGGAALPRGRLTEFRLPD